jgi:hypothetical protein
MDGEGSVWDETGRRRLGESEKSDCLESDFTELEIFFKERHYVVHYTDTKQLYTKADVI